MYSVRTGRGRASGHRQPSMGRDNLMNALAAPRRHPFITRFLLLPLYFCLSDEVRLPEFYSISYSCRLVSVTAGPGDSEKELGGVKREREEEKRGKRKK